MMAQVALVPKTSAVLRMTKRFLVGNGWRENPTAKDA
jgi:hypothetical protein